MIKRPRVILLNLLSSWFWEMVFGNPVWQMGTKEEKIIKSMSWLGLNAPVSLFTFFFALFYFYFLLYHRREIHDCCRPLKCCRQIIHGNSATTFFSTFYSQKLPFSSSDGNKMAWKCLFVLLGLFINGLFKFFVGFSVSGYSTETLNAASVHGARGLFTPSQWMELEHQALIYKYISANVPIPSNLLIPIRKALESAGFSSFSGGLLRPNACKHFPQFWLIQK